MSGHRNLIIRYLLKGGFRRRAKILLPNCPTANIKLTFLEGHFLFRLCSRGARMRIHASFRCCGMRDDSSPSRHDRTRMPSMGSCNRSPFIPTCIPTALKECTTAHEYMTMHVPVQLLVTLISVQSCVYELASECRNAFLLQASPSCNK